MKKLVALAFLLAASGVFADSPQTDAWRIRKMLTGSTVIAPKVETVKWPSGCTITGGVLDFTTCVAAASGGSSFVNLQGSTPGTAQTGHINVSGTVKSGAINMGGDVGLQRRSAGYFNITDGTGNNTGGSIVGTNAYFAALSTLGARVNITSALGLTIDGTVGAPAYTFENQPTMGWYRNAASDLRLTMDGSHDRLRIDTGATYIYGPDTGLADSVIVTNGELIATSGHKSALHCVSATCTIGDSTAGTQTINSGAHSLTFNPSGQLLMDGNGVDTGYVFSVVNIANQKGGSNIASNTSVGMRFQVSRKVSITGAQFYWSGAAQTVKVSLWTRAGVRSASVNVTTTNVPSIWTATFGSPVSVNVGDVYYVVMWETSGTNYQNMTVTNICLPGSSGASGAGFACTNNAANPTVVAPAIVAEGYNWFVAGDGVPTAGGAGVNNEYYPIEPTYQ